MEISYDSLISTIYSRLNNNTAQKIKFLAKVKNGKNKESELSVCRKKPTFKNLKAFFKHLKILKYFRNKILTVSSSSNNAD